MSKWWEKFCHFSACFFQTTEEASWCVQTANGVIDKSPIPDLAGNIALQVVTSGPDSPIQGIKETFIKMITNAKRTVVKIASADGKFVVIHNDCFTVQETVV